MTVSLTKGARVDLRKGQSGLSRLMLGLGWDPAKKAKSGGFLSGLLGGGQPESIDLDASALLFASGRHVDTVWFRQLQSRDGSIKHSGDNLTGDGDGDDETIMVDLDRLHAEVSHIVFTVNSFRGQTFNEVDNAVARVVDAARNVELAKFVLTDKGNHTGVVMGVLARGNGDWSFQAIGEPLDGRTAEDMASKVTRYL